MLSLKRNFLFIHIHKTGGNSIHAALLPYSDDYLEDLPHSHLSKDFEVKNSAFPSLRKHSTLQDYKDVLGGETFQQLYKFTCVRNPWKRLISFYFSPHRGGQAWSRAAFIKMMDIVPSASEMLTIADATNRNSISHHLDFVMRYENLSDDFSKVCQQIGLPSIQLPHRNKSKRKSYMDYYDDELLDIVEERYADDIRQFNYSKADFIHGKISNTI